MTNGNLVVINQEAADFICKPCSDRSFNSLTGLLQHCRQAKAHQGKWCGRCRRLFVSSSALQAHKRDSHAHWLCRFCDRDEIDDSLLMGHEVNGHNYCRECNCKFDNYAAHRIRSHHRCSHCDREFDNQNELLMHKQTHIPRNMECYGCERKFATASAILIHLESGNCSCGVTEDEIKTWAFECYQSRHYTNDIDSRLCFCCPECDVDFAHVSGLLQHVESPACDATYSGSIAKLRKYLANKTALYDHDGGSETSDSSIAESW